MFSIQCSFLYNFRVISLEFSEFILPTEHGNYIEITKGYLIHFEKFQQVAKIVFENSIRFQHLTMGMTISKEKNIILFNFANGPLDIIFITGEFFQVSNI